MHVSPEAPLEFKFHWLNEKGQQTGLLRKKGRFDGTTLVLDDIEVPASVIVHVETRDNRMALSAMTQSGEPATLLLMPTNTRQLKAALDVSRSGVWAEMHREALEKKGLGRTFRSEECPECGATLILSGMPASPQLYCRFCHTLSTIADDLQPPPGEKQLRLCDECGMFSKPRRFTIFYFYFLLVVWGWWSRSTWRCPACMRGEAWKMLAANFVFVLGIPVALVQLFRSYGGTDLAGPFRGLDTGNIKARKGDVGGALQQYRAILERVPHCAGLKYNLGLALLQQGDKSRAADAFAAALDECVNYVPAYAVVRPLYEELGETERLAELKAMWDDEDEAEESQ
ncbi:MAG: hypothetical protein DWQ34_12555 [Planctomycetota bacterium]|nr:MAG: hypothetical protein DWQ29_23470 [Planctomycetota bacterium]REJ92631.1 MAG: hypothetical protein DWQ34_12555 [Planctomycetota bacterium]REK26740.1 MAG: hypothetical protein DWQ41_09375 [Planctomycetota bacterium]